MHAREHLQQMSGTQQPPARGVHMCLLADEQHVEQALLGIQCVDKRRGHRDRLFESLRVTSRECRIKRQRMPFEEFGLELLHDGLADARETLPVDALHRITGLVIAQAEELLGVAAGGGQRNAAGLVAALTRQRNGRQTIAARQHQHRLRRRHL